MVVRTHKNVVLHVWYLIYLSNHYQVLISDLKASTSLRLGC